MQKAFNFISIQRLKQEHQVTAEKTIAKQTGKKNMLGQSTPGGQIFLSYIWPETEPEQTSREQYQQSQ